jgi:hypothetical protein
LYEVDYGHKNTLANELTMHDNKLHSLEDRMREKQLVYPKLAAFLYGLIFKLISQKEVVQYSSGEQ